ncbi:MAG: hypothetical protein KDA27_23755, partial [Candidatus Eisenbacteria bacterium]|nr:hypothetical protein [Candidatus Eisenbacteria bacterium]
RETTETPWIMSLPFRVEDGVEIPTRTRNVDIWPTLLDLLGLEPLENVDGRSVAGEILSALAGSDTGDPTQARTGPSEPVAFSFLDRTWGQVKQPPRPAVAVVDGPLRYVYARSSDGRATEQLFDRTADPQERTDVLAEHPDRAAEMRRQAEAHLDSFDAPPWGDATVSIEIDAMELNQLRALGYEIP